MRRTPCADSGSSPPGSPFLWCWPQPGAASRPAGRSRAREGSGWSSEALPAARRQAQCRPEARRKASGAGRFASSPREPSPSTWQKRPGGSSLCRPAGQKNEASLWLSSPRPDGCCTPRRSWRGRRFSRARQLRAVAASLPAPASSHSDMPRLGSPIASTPISSGAASGSIGGSGGIHLSRLPLATRLACDAKSLVAALRVGSDEYPRAALSRPWWRDRSGTGPGAAQAPPDPGRRRIR